MKTKNYQAPRIEIISVQSEGIMAASAGAGVNDFDNGGAMFSSGSNQSENSTMSEIEILIEEILTTR
ncbi:hypothetical protein [Bacteroides sp. 214]|uniref:hypothetical protein n=1 Tax=Bacteroides sp. 214 TaxID=2302935 RepID=UPI0013D23D87|nr:hypothetical protein [Bacteroides sp. 214]